MHTNTRWALCWRVGLAALLIAALVGLASQAQSQTPHGVLGVFGFSLLSSLGFLLFGQQRFDANPPDDQHKA